MKELIGLKTLANFPIECIWMLAVDGKFYAKENGPQEFEKRENNSVKGILKGLITALEGLGKELTITHLHAIHKSCMTDVRSRTPCVPGQFRQKIVCMDVMPGWISSEGMQDLISKLEPNSYLMPVTFFSDGDHLFLLEKIPLSERNKYKVAARTIDGLTPRNTNKQEIEAYLKKLNEHKIHLAYQPPEYGTIAKSIDEICKEYNQRIKLAKSDDGKLEIIVDSLQKFTRKHPYNDGNNRSLINSLLIELLIENGLIPTLFFEPNIFEFHTVKEIMAKIKEGQQLFLSIIKDPLQPVFGFDNSKIKDIDSGKYVQLGKELLQELNILINKIGKSYYQAKDYLLASQCFEINYELEKKLSGDQSPEAASILYNLASALKEVGGLQKTNDLSKLNEAKSFFNSEIVLFGKYKNEASLQKAQDKLRSIEALLNQSTNANLTHLIATNTRDNKNN